MLWGRGRGADLGVSSELKSGFPVEAQSRYAGNLSLNVTRPRSAMGVEGCTKCIKYLLFFFNFIFWVSGFQRLTRRARGGFHVRAGDVHVSGPSRAFH